MFVAVVSPLYRQVDPYELGKFGRFQAVSIEYATRLMGRWGYADCEPEVIDEIAHNLAWNYPEHGFVIDLHEAKELGLRAEELDPETEELCRELFGTTLSHTDISFPKVQKPSNGNADTERENYGDK